MNKNYLNKQQKDEDLSDYCDKEGKRFRLQNQKDVDQLHGKIRRLSGRDEIRKEAIKIVVRKRLNLSESLLAPWEDKIEENSEDTNMSEVKFYIPKAERDKIPSEDFGFVRDGRRLFPVRGQSDLDAAAKLIGRAKGLNDADRKAVKAKLLRIAKRKGLSPPKAWTDSAEMSCIDTVTIG